MSYDKHPETRGPRGPKTYTHGKTIQDATRRFEKAAQAHAAGGSIRLNFSWSGADLANFVAFMEMTEIRDPTMAIRAAVALAVEPVSRLTLLQRLQLRQSIEEIRAHVITHFVRATEPLVEELKRMGANAEEELKRLQEQAVIDSEALNNVESE